MGDKSAIPSILIVDDSPDNLNLLAELLKGEKWEIRVAPSGNFALRSVEMNPPDLILLDIRMPRIDGLEVCRRLKLEDKTRDIPVIFLTALDSMEDEEKGLRLGAVDYIVKPFHPEIVKARVRNHLNYIHQRKLLERLVKLDALTEIPNRRHFDEQLSREWYRALRVWKPVSLAIIDVDFFKRYNDSLGHPAGDVALIKIAQTLVQCVNRSVDLAARYGGEEFVVLLPGTNHKGARLLVEKIREMVEELDLRFPRETGMSHLTVSIGGSTMVPSANSNDSDLIDQADTNLYQAKRLGRNRVVWPNPTDSVKTNHNDP
ncbi:MAG: diguanylate cyclase [Pseudomonadota bacterium]